ECRGQKTYLNPPAYTQTTDEIGDKDGKQSVNSPIVRHTHMAEIMGRKDELVPCQSKKDRTRHEPAVLVGIHRQRSQEDVAQHLGPIASEVRCFIQACIHYTFV